jgi:antitoxin HicB
MTTQVKSETLSELESYMALPYRIELIPDPEDGGYVVRIPDLPGCMSQGDTVEEAMEMIRDAQRGWLTVALEHGDSIPQPRGAGAYSGQFNVRLPKSVHRALVEAAEAEGVSLNLYVATVLAHAVGINETPRHTRRRATVPASAR